MVEYKDNLTKISDTAFFKSSFKRNRVLGPQPCKFDVLNDCLFVF